MKKGKKSSHDQSYGQSPYDHKPSATSCFSQDEEGEARSTGSEKLAEQQIPIGNQERSAFFYRISRTWWHCYFNPPVVFNTVKRSWLRRWQSQLRYSHYLTIWRISFPLKWLICQNSKTRLSMIVFLKLKISCQCCYVWRVYIYIHT